MITYLLTVYYNKAKRVAIMTNTAQANIVLVYSLFNLLSPSGQFSCGQSLDPLVDS